MSNFLDSMDYLQALLVISILFAVYVLWRLHRARNRLDLSDFIVGEDGTLSASKLFQFGAFLVSSWGFVYLIVHDRFHEWYYGLYMGAWVFNKLFTQYLSTKATTATASVSVPAGGGTVGVQVEN